MAKQFIRLGLVVVCLGLGVLEARAETVTSVAAGYLHTCALTTGGRVLCWGGNEDGPRLMTALALPIRYSTFMSSPNGLTRSR